MLIEKCKKKEFCNYPRKIKIWKNSLNYWRNLHNQYINEIEEFIIKNPTHNFFFQVEITSFFNIIGKLFKFLSNWPLFREREKESKD